MLELLPAECGECGEVLGGEWSSGGDLEDGVSLTADCCDAGQLCRSCREPGKHGCVGYPPPEEVAAECCVCTGARWVKFCPSCERSYDRMTCKDGTVAAVILWVARRVRRAMRKGERRTRVRLEESR